MNYDVNTFDSVSIRIASPETIRKWSRGEVRKPETINGGIESNTVCSGGRISRPFSRPCSGKRDPALLYSSSAVYIGVSPLLVIFTLLTSVTS